MGYAVVTPAHNEEHNLDRVAACMAAQSLLPSTWVIVENGSTDGTLASALALAEQHPWLRVTRAVVPEATERGAPIVHAIHAGLEALAPLPEVVCQLDADISFRPEYFERLVAELEWDPQLGIASGTCFEQTGDHWRERFTTGANVWGGARAYRRECLRQILPLEPRTGWDAIDVAQANALGWRTQTFRELRFDHHRREASRERSRWSAWYDQGRVSHFLGYRPGYLLLRSLFRSRTDPAGLGLAAGYLAAALGREHRCMRPGVVDWVRRQQGLRMLARRAAEARGRANDGATL